MRLKNATDAAIMYALNKNKFKELKPNAFIFVPDECRNLHIKPAETTYTLSVDQMMNNTLGDIDNVVVADNIRSQSEAYTLVVNEDPESQFGKFLNFGYINAAGFTERIYAPKFDITVYDIAGAKVVKVNKEKINAKLKKVTNDDSSKMWILIILLIIVAVVIILPLVYLLVKKSEHD